MPLHRPFYQQPLLFGAGLFLIITLFTACFATSPFSATPPTPQQTVEPPTAQPAPVQPNTQLELFSWWLNGEDADALESLFRAYRANHPEVELIHATIANGGILAARPVLAARLAGGDPPDTWQMQPGFEMNNRYLAPGSLQAISDLYATNNWAEAFPPSLLSLSSHDGIPYMVIAGVQRQNVLWFHKKLLEQNGIEIGHYLSLEELIEIANQLRSVGVPVFCTGTIDGVSMAQLFENTLLSVLGPKSYDNLWTGELSFASDSVKQAIERYAQLLAYQSQDTRLSRWEQAAKNLVKGECAFISAGDWLHNTLIAAGQIEMEDFGWVAYPGTDGSFFLVADGFGLAQNAPHAQAAKDWLKLVGSKAAQEEFNLRRGSLCARLDCDQSRFSLYHQWAMQSLERDPLALSVVQGLAAPPAFQQALLEAVSLFATDGDAETFRKTLIEAATRSGVGK